MNDSRLKLPVTKSRLDVIKFIKFKACETIFDNIIREFRIVDSLVLRDHKSFLLIEKNKARWRMLSFNATEPPSSEVAPTPTEVAPKPRRRWLIVAAVVIVIVVVAAVFAYWWFSRPSPASQASWLFAGAYAEYSGKTTVPITQVTTMELNMTMRLRVVDYNSTHAKLLTYMKMESNMMQPFESEDTTWADLRATTASYEVEGYDLTQTREDDVYIEGLGTKHCMIYEYSSSGMTMTYYLDKEINWPVKMEFSMTQSSIHMDFDLTLKDTNIPGL